MIHTELTAVNLTSLDEWKTRITGCTSDDGCDPYLSCDMLTHGGVWGSMCDHALAHAGVNELRRSIAAHVLSTQHVMLTRSKDGVFHAVRGGTRVPDESETGNE